MLPAALAAALLAALLCGPLGFALGRRRAERGLRAAHADLRRHSAYVRLLECAAVAANEAATLDEAMAEGARRIGLAMGWPLARIHVVEADGTLQETRRFRVESDRRPSVSGDGPPDTGAWIPGELAERALATGRPEWGRDPALPAASSAADAALPSDLSAAVAIPVLTHGRVAAVLELFLREEIEPEPRLLETLALVGVQIGRVAERASLAQRVRQAQKLEAIGRLSASIAHEVNNPMAFVRSNLNHLAAECKRLRAEIEALDGGSALSGSLASCAEIIDETLEGVERTVLIVRDMKEFAELGDELRVPWSPREIVATALRVASARKPPGVVLESREAEVPPVRCRPSQLVQVLVNVLVNAIEAASPSGRVEVSLHREEDGVVVQVEDDGPGMSAQTRERIFDPFFTTKPPGEGTGLGLAISYEIVRSHGGEIRVISAEGAGTVIEVRLPLDA